MQVIVVTLEGNKEGLLRNLYSAPQKSGVAPDIKGFINFIGCNRSILIRL